ncbi:MAG: hypothetical protein ABJC62_13350 [Frankiaceae bacterium]
MNNREAAMAHDESVKRASQQSTSEKCDPLLQRYLGAALQKTLADERRNAQPAK